MTEVVRTSIDTAGIDPAEVADQVVDAIRGDTFWILTHPETRQQPVERMRRAAAHVNPVIGTP